MNRKCKNRSYFNYAIRSAICSNFTKFIIIILESYYRWKYKRIFNFIL